MPRELFANKAAVATGHPLGAAAGLEMLRDGGNAIDAAVAAMLALCVVIPGSVGLGGYGGSAVIYFARSRRVVAVDFDSRAPLAFRDGLVTAEQGFKLLRGASVTVPAVVAGLDLILREFGTKSWRRGVAAGDSIGRGRFRIRLRTRAAPRSLRAAVRSDSRWRIFFPMAQAPELGIVLATAGPLPGFCNGWRTTGRKRFTKARSRGPSSATSATAAAFSPKRIFVLTARRLSKPLAQNCRGHELATPPPPSGGITSLAIVQTVEQFAWRRVD